ncbi:MAG: hypothetical protein LCH81_14475 [Bacteroidetes bacterium]|nr:hypothetical protein [Bacteroidota bacterium]
MTVIFQIEAMSELEEISAWLAQRKIVIQKVESGKIGSDAFLKRLRRYKINLPVDYRFNRDEANER